MKKRFYIQSNVFQICALKNAESGSLTRRRQEVGRGMRLCVNKNGNRLDFESVGDQVHEINKLTVIASESYEAFAKGLQSEIAATLKDRPMKIEAKVFLNKMVVNEKGDFSGSVSGGCVESAVVRECVDLIKKNKTCKKIEFKVSNESAWEVGLACGGEIAVYLEQII